MSPFDSAALRAFSEARTFRLAYPSPECASKLTSPEPRLRSPEPRCEALGRLHDVFSRDRRDQQLLSGRYGSFEAPAPVARVASRGRGRIPAP